MKPYPRVPLVLSLLLACILTTAVLAQAPPPPPPPTAPTPATPTLSQAARLRGQGRAEEAIKAYEAVLQGAQTDDERALALQGLASVYVGRDNARARETYHRLIALPAANAKLKQAAWRQLGSLARREDDLAGAREAYRHLQTDFPGDPEGAIAATLELAVLEANEGDPAQAVESLRKLLKTAEKSPRLPEVYLALINAQAAAGDLKGAEQTARAAGQRYPGRRDFLVTLAGAYEAAGKPAEAAPLIQELLTKGPQEHDLFRSLYDLMKEQQALLHFERGEGAEATALLEQLRTTSLRDAALLLLAQVRLWEGQTPAALAVLDELVKDCTDSPLAPEAQYLGATALLVSDRAESQRRLEALVERYPQAPQTEQARLILENWRRQAESK